VNVPTSNFVYTKPTPLNPEPAPVVERTPVPDYSDSDSDSELDEDAYEPPVGAPTDIEIVRRLERALPRYAPLLGEEGGWMADVKQERHLEIVQAVKAYRDAAYVESSYTCFRTDEMWQQRQTVHSARRGPGGQGASMWIRLKSFSLPHADANLLPPP
jgi:hypothetical protein